jgi:hypothetical protein
VAAVIVAAVVVRVLLGDRVAAPVVLCDEFIYANLAKNLAEHGRYLFRGVPQHQSFVYPPLIAPAWLADSMGTTYFLAKAVGAAAMSLTALPVYLWGRRVASPAYALVAAVLSLLLPAFFYSGLLMTEAAFLPAFVLAAYALALALERPTLARQLLALAAVAVAVGVRVQGLALLLVIPTAALAKAGLDLRAGVGRANVRLSLRRLWPTGLVLAGGALVYVAYKALRRAPLSSGLGPYESLARKHYPLVETAKWAVKHLAELGLALGLVPVSALIVLLWCSLRGTRTSDAERAFLAVVCASIVWLLVEVGAFAASVTPFVFERYTFYLQPLLVLAFVVWLARGLPRPLVGTAVATAVPILLLLTLRLRTVIVPDVVNGVTVDSLYKLSRHLPGGLEELKWAIGAGALLGAFLFAVCARRLAGVALPLLLALYLVAASKPALSDVESASRSTRAYAGSDASWVVRAIGRDRRAVYVNTPTAGSGPSDVLLETEFWNPNLTGVYGVGGGEICPLPETPTVTHTATGVIAPPLPEGVDHAIVDRRVPFSGRFVASGGPGDQPLALYRVGRSLRIGSLTSGLFADGWMGEQASYSIFATRGNRRGRLVVTLGRTGWSGPDVPGRVRIAVGRPARSTGLAKVFEVRRWVVNRLAQRTFVFDVPAPPVRAEVRVRPTFSPAQFSGYSDTRQLGAQVSFRFEPS